MADKHPINLPAKPSTDPEGTSWQRTKDQKTLHAYIREDSVDNKNPEGATGR